MKTRIVYPALWLDEGFAQCELNTKLYFMYLITNQALGLSRYTRISDRRVSFDTGLNTVQIKQAKEELEQLKWCYFKDEWVFQNHNCAYVDYIRNEKVSISKEKEIENVPSDIREYFNAFCLNKIETDFKQSLNINNKPEIINQKPKEQASAPRTESLYRQELAALTDEVLEEISTKYSVSLNFVKSKKDDLENWVCEKPSRGRDRDFRRTLMKWVKMAIDEGKVKKVEKFVAPTVPEISEEDRLNNLRMLDEMKAKKPFLRRVSA